MIEINLLPEERRKKQERFKKIDISKVNLQNIQVLFLIAGIFGIVLVLQVVLFLIGIYSNSLVTSLEKKYREISPQEKEAKLLNGQLDTINKKTAAIDELMVRRFSWTNKLNDLSDSVTPGIWLTELSYNEKMIDKLVQPDAKMLRVKNSVIPAKPVTEKVVLRNMVISGYASSMGEGGTALVGKFIKSLKDNSDFYSDFSDIELGGIKSDKIEDQEVMNFKINCIFK